MATLYIRDVPDDVAEVLKQRAADQGASLSAYLAAELTKLSVHTSNAEIVRRLRELDRSGAPETGQIVEAVRAERR